MFADNFDPVATLAGERCPRCAGQGLVESDQESHDAARAEDRHVPHAYINPSVYCRCPQCGLEAEWPSCVN